MKTQIQERIGKRRTARTNGLIFKHKGRHRGGQTWLVLGQRYKLADEGGQVKERTESQTEGQKEAGQNGSTYICGRQPKSDKRQKRNLKVFYNPMGLDQGTGSLDMKYILR
jgi:hypothetical protein